MTLSRATTLLHVASSPSPDSVTVIGLPRKPATNAKGRTYSALLRNTESGRVSVLTYDGPSTAPTAVFEDPFYLYDLGVFWSEGVSIALMTVLPYTGVTSIPELVRGFIARLAEKSVAVQFASRLDATQGPKYDIYGYLVIDGIAVALVEDTPGKSSLVLARLAKDCDSDYMRVSTVLQPM